MPKLPPTEGIDTLIQDYDMLPPGSKVLCAVSGGADSICLLHILSQREDISLLAAHFNHRLRGEESDRDERFVRELCGKWHIPLTVGQGDVAAHAEKQGLSVEEAARDLRYAFLREAAEENDCELIATAHNADDNAETVLLNLIRGTGPKGLSGIPPRRGNIIRPLLTVTRKEIEAYLELYRLPHVEDSTNADTAYTRNRLRHQVMPLLRELNPRVTEHINTAAIQLCQVDQYLDTEAQKYLSQARLDPYRASLPTEVLRQAPEFLQPRILLCLLDTLSVGRKDFGAAHLKAILSLSPGGRLDLPHGVTARREYDTLVLATQKDNGPIWTSFSLREGENPVPGTDWVVMVSCPPWPGLAVRPRQTGDEITLPGRPRRSLKKLFIDRKVPRWDRDTLPVAADDAGVIAVAGLGPNTAHPRFNEVQIIQKKEEKDNE